MKATRLLIAFLIFINSNLFSQNGGSKYFFKAVNWTIVLPSGFIVRDSLSNTESNERGKKLAENANNIKADVSETITLIGATKNTYDFFNSTITPFNSKNNWDSMNNMIKDVSYNTFHYKIPKAKIDTVTAFRVIDGLKFDELKVTVILEEKFLFTAVILSRLHKGYQFGISYLFRDEETKNEIEKMLNNSKFEK